MSEHCGTGVLFMRASLSPVATPIAVKAELPRGGECNAVRRLITRAKTGALISHSMK